jgi:Spy/CpxP family protein refolding chaperone
MKLNNPVSLWVLAIAGIGGAVGIATAQTTSSSTTTPTPPTPSHKWHRHHGGFLLGTLLRATQQLNLTAEQQASIKTILSTAHAQAKAAHSGNQPPVDITVLGNPGDPNYATQLETAKTFAANRIQTESELEDQVYNVLTAQQKTQLPTVLAAMKAQAAQRRANWQAQHAGATNSG